MKAKLGDLDFQKFKGFWKFHGKDLVEVQKGHSRSLEV